MRDAERVRLQAQAKQASVPVERRRCVDDLKLGNVVSREHRQPIPLRALTDEAGLQRSVAQRAYRDNPHGLVEGTPDQDLPVPDRNMKAHRRQTPSG